MNCKTCTSCNQSKMLTAFDRNKKSRGGFFNQCKECRRDRRNAAYARDVAESCAFEDRPHVSHETPQERHLRMVKRGLRWSAHGDGGISGASLFGSRSAPHAAAY